VTTDRRDLPGPDRARARELLRPRGGSARVTNVELYFDLVSVFAVTQLSTYLIRHPDATGAMLLGGSALFLAGHAAFRAVLWRRVPWAKLGGLMLIALLGLVAPHVSALVLSGCAAALLVAVAAVDSVSPAAAGVSGTGSDAGRLPGRAVSRCKLCALGGHEAE